jgi:hypothetical protein
MAKTTKAQRLAIYRKWCQSNQGLTYRQFRATVRAESYGPALMVQWCGMWLGIEPDGYTHS